MTFSEFCDAVRMYGMLTGGSVTSWGRSTSHNKEVGGVPYSPHRFWMAADFVYDAPVPLPERLQIATRLGLKLVVEDGHDHAQAASWMAG